MTDMYVIPVGDDGDVKRGFIVVSLPRSTTGLHIVSYSPAREQAMALDLSRERALELTNRLMSLLRYP